MRWQWSCMRPGGSWASARPEVNERSESDLHAQRDPADVELVHQRIGELGVSQANRCARRKRPADADAIKHRGLGIGLGVGAGLPIQLEFDFQCRLAEE